MVAFSTTWCIARFCMLDTFGISLANLENFTNHLDVVRLLEPGRKMQILLQDLSADIQVKEV